MRQIEKEMVRYLDKKLENNGLAKKAIELKDARTLIALAAEACVGIREDTGRNDGKFIRLIQETVGNAVGEPYCVAGAMTCLNYAEIKTGIRSPLIATEHAQTLWYKTPAKFRVKKIPLIGAFAIWGDVGKSSGHLEIVRSADEKMFYAVGFNTSGSTNPNGVVDREGNGVFYTVRNYKSTSKRKLLGFLKPY